MNREEYLATEWSAYPVLPDDSVHHGRVVNLRHGHLAIWRQGHVKEVEVRGAPSHREIALEHLLRPGDLVSVNAAGFVTLLAPWRTDGIFRAFPAETLRQWNVFLAAIHDFFVERGFASVPTPGLVVCPGTEPSLDVFATELIHGSRRRTLYLPTSPELHLKKALARGLEKIFEIKACYRNGERTDIHRAEFHMLEWYRAWEKPAALHRDIGELVEFVAQRLAEWSPRTPRALRRLTMAEAFRRYLGEEITPRSNFADYAAIAQRAGLEVPAGFGLDDVFFLIFTERIEPKFPPDEITLVEHWPPFQAALARLTPEGWADRFEIYWQGLELANAFHELNDPAVQRERFAEDRAKKIAAGKEPVPIDEDFLKALDSGLPPSSGIAMGVDRLFMAVTGRQNIAELRFFEEPARGSAGI